MINSTQIQCENPFSSPITLEPDYICESLLPELELHENHFLSTPSPKENNSLSNLFHKKLNHNAYERDRRKKLNGLYSSLCMLLPEADRSKKMSIPVTVSRVLKYVPELQKQVAKLTKKKEQLLKKGSLWQEHNNSTSKDHCTDSLVVNATCLNEKEVMVNICILSKRANKDPLFKYLEILEREGLKLINASTSCPLGERSFYNLHFEIVQGKGMERELFCEHLTKAVREKAIL